VTGGGSLFRVARTDTVRIYVGVPESYAPGLRLGLQADVSVQELGGRFFHGQVVRTARAFDAASRTLLTEVDVVNPDRLLVPGMYAQVSFGLSQPTPPIIIPAAALLVRTEGAQVAVVDTTNHVVQFRHVTIGRDYGATIEVDSGVTDGDLVVVNPPDDLRNGQHVRPRPAPQGGAAGGSSSGGRPANPPPDSSEQPGQGSRGKPGRSGNQGNGNSDSGSRGGQSGQKDTASNSGGESAKPITPQTPIGAPGQP
jgi:membrane fusion protein (multidrug efflux system)